MIGHKHDDCVLFKAILFQSLEDKLHLLVDRHDAVEILRPDGPSDRVVGVVRWNLDTRGTSRLRNLSMGLVPAAATMCLTEVELGQERLVRFELIPTVYVKRLATFGIREIPIGLAGAAVKPAGLKVGCQLLQVCGAVSGFPETVGDKSHTIWKWCFAVAMRAMIVCVDTHGIHASHER